MRDCGAAVVVPEVGEEGRSRPRSDDPASEDGDGIRERLAGAGQAVRRKLKASTDKAWSLGGEVGRGATDLARGVGSAGARTSRKVLNRTGGVVGRAAQLQKERLQRAAPTVGRVVLGLREAAGNTNESASRFLAERYRESEFVRRAAAGAGLSLWPALDAQWLKELLQSAASVSTPTPWDRAMDAVYNAGREHGYLHRLFDGGHSIKGALEAGSSAVPGSNWIENTSGSLNAIWRDATTPLGMPFVTLSREWFDEASTAVSNFSDRYAGGVVPSDLLRDWVTWDAAEFVTSSLGATIVVFQFKEERAVQLARTAGSLGLVGVASANPLAVVVSGVALARSLQVRGTARTGAEALRGAAVSAAAIGGGKVAAAVGLGSIASGLVAPVAVGVGASVVIGVLADQWRRGAVARREERELALFDAVGLA